MISVIMLTYNRRELVPHMIEDILGQTYGDFEFIIVNNGSTDGTDVLLRDFSNRDRRVKIINISPSSIGRARNIGLSLARGEFVAYVDDDDRVKKDFLKFLISLIREHDADISMCGASEGDGVTRRPQCLFDEKYVLSGEEAVRLLLDRKYIRNGTATKLYRREILEKFPFVENYRNEDLHTQYKYLLSSKVVVIQGVDNYYITRHASNVSGFTSDASKWDAKTIQDYFDAYHNRTDYLRIHAPSLYEQALYSEWSFMISMVDKIESYGLSGCNGIERTFLTELEHHREDFLNMPYIQDIERSWINRYLGKEDRLSLLFGEI